MREETKIHLLPTHVYDCQGIVQVSWSNTHVDYVSIGFKTPTVRTKHVPRKISQLNLPLPLSFYTEEVLSGSDINYIIQAVSKLRLKLLLTKGVPPS